MFIHPVIGKTPRFTPEMIAPELRAKFQKNKAHMADVFRCYMAANTTEDLIYVDLDVCFLKDMSPLTQTGDFVYEWENQKFANTAIIYVSQQGVLRKELGNVVSDKLVVAPWIIFAYDTPMMRKITVYPCEIFDPFWKGSLTSPEGTPDFDDFFIKNRKTEHILRCINESCYAVHWHNRWYVKPEAGSPYCRLLDGFRAEYDGQYK